jgi:hypothetical protein
MLLLIFREQLARELFGIVEIAVHHFDGDQSGSTPPEPSCNLNREHLAPALLLPRST